MATTDEILTRLYRTALPRLCSYGFALTGSESEGEELVQAAIVKTFSRSRRIDDERAAEGYVRATMRTLAIDAGRRATRWRRVMPTQLARPARPLDDEVADADAVAAALRRLPPRVRVAVVLRYLDDLTIADTATQMGVTDGAVKKYLHTARELLGPAWGEQSAEELAVEPAQRRAR